MGEVQALPAQLHTSQDMGEGVPWSCWLPPSLCGVIIQLGDTVPPAGFRHRGWPAEARLMRRPQMVKQTPYSATVLPLLP